MTKKRTGLRTMTDVLKNAAARIFRVPVEKVTPEMREALKIATFAHRYGMGDKIKYKSLQGYLDTINEYKKKNSK